MPGPHQATFYYRDTVAGPHTLTVGSTGLTGNSAPLTVDPGPRGEARLRDGAADRVGRQHRSA